MRGILIIPQAYRSAPYFSCSTIVIDLDNAEGYPTEALGLQLSMPSPSKPYLP